MAKEESGQALLDAKLDELGISDDTVPAEAAENVEDEPKDAPVDDKTPVAEDVKDADAADAADTEPDADSDAVEDDDAASDVTRLTSLQRQTAEELGLSADDIEAFGERAPAMLDGMRRKISRKMSDLGRLQQKLKTGDTKRTASDDTEAYADEFPELDTDAEWDDIVKSQNAANRQMRALLRDRDSRSLREQKRSRNEFFNSLVDDKGNSLFPEFGVDPGEGTEASEAREFLWRDAKCIQIGYEASGRVLSIADALQMSLDHYGKDTYEQAAVSGRDKAVRKQRGKAVVRAGATKSPAKRMSAADKIAAEFTAFEKRTGHSVPDR